MNLQFSNLILIVNLKMSRIHQDYFTARWSVLDGCREL